MTDDATAPRIDADESAARYDSLVNLLSEMGNESRDKSAAWDVDGYRRTLTATQLDALYASGDTLAGRCVDLPVDETHKRGFAVYVAGDERREVEPFRDEFKRLKLASTLRDADRWGDLYGGAAIIIDADDGQPASEPLNVDALKSVRSLIVADRHELVRLHNYVEADGVELSKMGTVRVYQYTPHTYGAETRAVHESRVIRFTGFQLPPRLREQYDGWGQPVLERYIDALHGVKSADAAIGILLHEWRIAVLGVKGLAQMAQAKGGTAQLATRMAAFNVSKSISGLAVIDGDGESFSQQGAPVSGLADLYDRVCQRLSSITNIPLTKLQGTTPGGLSTDDKSGRTTWYDHVESRRERKLREPIERVCELLVASGEVVLGDDASFVVEFPPLEIPTESETTEMRRKQAETDGDYFDMGVLSAQEIRDSRFGGAGYSADTRLSADAPDDGTPGS